jgi:arsenate reductase
MREGVESGTGCMKSDWVLWFDARCPTSRRALELLRERGVEPALRRHLEEPPTPEELTALAARLGVPAHGLCRTDEDEYQVLRLSPRTPEAELVAALARHPRIVERPILVAGERAIVARPPERVLELLGDLPGSRPAR